MVSRQGTWSRVREQWRADEKIRHLAHYDDLTDLPKRTIFLNRLTDGVNRLGIDGKVVGLLCLDIDNFKQINDSMAHATGDKLLRQFADRLRANTRETDLLCRLGGDEFAIALRGLNSPDSIPTLSNRLREQLAVPYVIDGREIATTVSIGVSVAPTDTTDAATMLKSADLALYRCKSEGRNRFDFLKSRWTSPSNSAFNSARN